MKRKKVQRELTEDETAVVIAVRHCARELSDFLQGARRKSQSNVIYFAESGVPTFFRGIFSYADMYEKVGVRSRTELYTLFKRSRDCDELQDTQDAIEEIEGLMHNFLSNLETDVVNKSKERGIDLPVFEQFDKPSLGSCIAVDKIILTDLLKNREFRLMDLISKSASTFIICQPCYLPDTAVRYRIEEVKKVKPDFDEFNVKCMVVTWGPKQDVKIWARTLRRSCDWPILYDAEAFLPKYLRFKKGASRVWSPDMLEFCGLQKTLKQWPMNPPPNDMNWLEWPWTGGELVLSREKVDYAKLRNTRVHQLREFDNPSSSDGFRRKMKRLGRDSSSEDDDDTDDPDRQAKQFGPEMPLPENETRLTMLHRANNLADLTNSGCIYQAALSCYAKAKNATEAQVLDRIRESRKMRIAPEETRMEKQEGSAMMYDPATEMYLDPQSGYFWSAQQRAYFYWNKEQERYERADALVQADAAARQLQAHAEQQRAALQAMQEKEAAQRAAVAVAAQLAAIRAKKDDYAAYAYATCVEPQAAQMYGTPDDMFRVAEAEKKASQLSHDMDRMARQHQKQQEQQQRQNAIQQVDTNDPPPPGVELD